MKKGILAMALLIAALLNTQAQQSEIFAPGGKAIKGYDPVAFFKETQPVKGADSLLYNWKNVNWYFASQQNLDSFKTNPEKYAPQYGGYCAYGTSQGHKAPTETSTWTIVNGKLYFNYNGKVKEIWTKDQPTLIEKADQQWPTVKKS
jgi:YHS domain-containing protein